MDTRIVRKKQYEVLPFLLVRLLPLLGLAFFNFHLTVIQFPRRRINDYKIYNSFDLEWSGQGI
jgi:hypothetical protein